MHHHHVDAERAHLGGDGGGKHGEERLGARVQRREGVGEEAGGRGGVGEQPYPLGGHHLVEEVVRDRHGARRVAVVVGEPLAEWHVREEADADEAGVVEDERDVDVLGGRDDWPHVHRLVALGERDTHLAKMQVRVLALKLRVEVVEQRVLQSHDDDVDALLDELLHNRTADPRRAASHERPVGFVPLLEVVREQHVAHQVLHEQQPNVGRQRHEADKGEGCEVGVRDHCLDERAPRLHGQR
mmetsp:Transcript_15705/g.40006  ORF Transcript_15705/g.40006 Transcript_15705/m.40006 type:complete len:242 (-) Transcript_15705:123-848(-)